MPPAGSTRFAATANFTIDGIENGIILAVPTSRAAQGVMWPARVRHVVEGKLTATGNVRRNSSKNQVQVVFLAPFWNGQPTLSAVSDAKDPYSIGPLYEFDTIDVSEYSIQKYPFDALSLEKVQGSFRFLGLPRAVFPRYLDSHRIAVALKMYAMKHISRDQAPQSDDQILASASLTESHALSVRTPIFPDVALTVPFDFILGKLPHPSDLASATTMTDADDDTEPTIDIQTIITSMSPPECFGKKPLDASQQETNSLLTPEYRKNVILSPDPTFTPALKTVASSQSEDDQALWSINKFASDFLCGLFQTQSSISNDLFALGGLAHMEKLLTSLIAQLRQVSEASKGYDAGKRASELRNILLSVMLIKSHGEESLDCGPLPPGVSKTTIIIEWRKACERLYKRAVSKLSTEGFGNNVTSVLTDSRCNGHITQSGSFEVRFIL